MEALCCNINILIPILREKVFEIASYIIDYHVQEHLGTNDEIKIGNTDEARQYEGQVCSGNG